jgi:hypothetical protein
MVNVQTPDRPRGRAVPAYARHTFADSGISVSLRKIGPSTLQSVANGIRKEAKAYPIGHEHKFPEPPVQIVDIAGERSEEINPNDPDYQAKLDQWGNWAMGEINTRLLHLAAADAVIPDAPPEEIAEEAQRVRRSLARAGAAVDDLPGYTAEEADRIVWVQHVCIASPEDLKEFYEAITQRSAVTEEAIDDVTATFRPAP